MHEDDNCVLTLLHNFAYFDNNFKIKVLNNNNNTTNTTAVLLSSPPTVKFVVNYLSGSSET